MEPLGWMHPPHNRAAGSLLNLSPLSTLKVIWRGIHNTFMALSSHGLEKDSFT